jgi:hypothetical protein
MSDFSNFGALLGLTALLSAPGLAQNSAPASEQASAPVSAQTRPDASTAKVAHVEQVVVHAPTTADAALTVEIQTSGARVAPDTQVITGPDRIVVDFPGALPAAALHALTVNQGALKAIRTGLFFNDPPITRVVLDLAEPQSYQISTTGNGIVIKLNSAKVNQAKLNPAKPDSATLNPVKSSSVKADSNKPNPVKASPVKLNSVKSNPANAAKLNSATLSLDMGGPGITIERYPVAPGARTTVSTPAPAAELGATFSLTPKPANAVPANAVPTNAVPTNAVPTNASPTSALPVVAANAGGSVAAANAPPVVSAAIATPAPLLQPIADEQAPPQPAVSVTFANGMLSIHAVKATLAQVLFEVQRQTQADIAIPAGAEQEEVIADLGPASARDVLGALLNGSTYNFIFVGSEARLERVILTQRDPNLF